jgi:hypothetical protein
LTLIELVVVLTILVALGGLIVPMLPNFLARTHFAKCSTTIPEINKLWITSFTGDVTYPDGYDSLTDGTALFAALPGGNAGGQVAFGTVGAGETAGLAAVGVTTVFDHTVAAPANATLDGVPNYALAAGRPIAGGGAFLTDGTGILTSDGATPAPPRAAWALSLGVDVERYAPGTRFLVMGIGNGCTAVGPKGLMAEAPTHFGGEDVMNPVATYQRYCVIFAVNEAEETAEFVCACSIHPDGFDGAEAHIRAYYEDRQS